MFRLLIIVDYDSVLDCLLLKQVQDMVCGFDQGVVIYELELGRALHDFRAPHEGLLLVRLCQVELVYHAIH